MAIRFLAAVLFAFAHVSAWANDPVIYAGKSMGAGAYGQVYEGVDKNGKPVLIDGKPVAVKVSPLNATTLVSQAYAYPLLEPYGGVRLLAPRVEVLFPNPDGSVTKIPGLAMEKLDGLSVSDLVQEVSSGRTLEELGFKLKPEAVYRFHQRLLAVTGISDPNAKYVFNDPHSGNLFITRDGEVHLLDAAFAERSAMVVAADQSRPCRAADSSAQGAEHRLCQCAEHRAE